MDNNLDVDFKSVIKKKLYNYLKDPDICDPRYHYMCQSYNISNICLLNINNVDNILNDWGIMYLHRNFTEGTIIFSCIKNPNPRGYLILKNSTSNELITLKYLLENY